MEKVMLKNKVLNKVNAHATQVGYKESQKERFKVSTGDGDA